MRKIQLPVIRGICRILLLPLRAVLLLLGDLVYLIGRAVSAGFRGICGFFRRRHDTAAHAVRQYRTRHSVLRLLGSVIAGENGILRSVLEEFPLKAVGVYLPEWLDALPQENALRKKLFEQIRKAGEELDKIKDVAAMMEKLEEEKLISSLTLRQSDLGTGNAAICASLPRDLYYATISEETGITVHNDGDLIATLSEMSAIRQDYERLRGALEQVRSTGYGVVMPDAEQMQLEEPQIVRQGGKYSVKLKANAPAIHMFKTNVETEVTPAIGGESASEDIINFLLQGFDGDINRIWQSNIFGKSLNDIAEEGLMAKIEALPENARGKLRETIERVINEGSGGLICILL